MPAEEPGYECLKLPAVAAATFRQSELVIRIFLDAESEATYGQILQSLTSSIFQERNLRALFFSIEAVANH